RSLDPVVHGIHDVTLCLGILYHLDAADVVRLLRAMRNCTQGFAGIDTHIASPEALSVAYAEGHEFYGHSFAELPGWWSSIGNPQSWWFTIASLHDAIRLAGWTKIEDLDGVRWPGEPA